MPGNSFKIEEIGVVRFSRNRRSKSIKISVKPDKSVLVSYPFYCTAHEVKAFLAKSKSWILEQQQKIEKRKNRVERNSVIETKLFRILFLQGKDFDVAINTDEVKITVPDFNSEESQQFIDNILTETYRYEAKKILPGRLAALAEKHGFSYNRVTIRNNRRNWGSCSSKNNISLNLQMMKLPDELIDYILLHELVHTEIKNHGPGFWEKLNGITDNRARELAKQVKQYSTYTI